MYVCVYVCVRVCVQLVGFRASEHGPLCILYGIRLSLHVVTMFSRIDLRV